VLTWIPLECVFSNCEATEEEVYLSGHPSELCPQRVCGAVAHLRRIDPSYFRVASLSLSRKQGRHSQSEPLYWIDGFAPI
jgi:hypothetical protein